MTKKYFVYGMSDNAEIKIVDIIRETEERLLTHVEDMTDAS